MTEAHKNKWEGLTALGTLSILNKEDDIALDYFQNAMNIHQTHEIKDEAYLNVEMILLQKIETTKKRIQLNRSLSLINRDLTKTYENIDFDEDSGEKITPNDILNSMKSIAKKGILKHDDKTPYFLKKLEGKQR